MDIAISTVRALEEAIRQVDRGDGVEATDAGQRGVVVAQGEGGRKRQVLLQDHAQGRVPVDPQLGAGDHRVARLGRVDVAALERREGLDVLEAGGEGDDLGELVDVAGEQAHRVDRQRAIDDQRRL